MTSAVTAANLATIVIGSSLIKLEHQKSKKKGGDGQKKIRGRNGIRPDSNMGENGNVHVHDYVSVKVNVNVGNLSQVVSTK